MIKTIRGLYSFEHRNRVRRQKILNIKENKVGLDDDKRRESDVSSDESSSSDEGGSEDKTERLGRNMEVELNYIVEYDEKGNVIKVPVSGYDYDDDKTSALEPAENPFVNENKDVALVRRAETYYLVIIHNEKIKKLN